MSRGIARTPASYETCILFRLLGGVCGLRQMSSPPVFCRLSCPRIYLKSYGSLGKGGVDLAGTRRALVRVIALLPLVEGVCRLIGC